MQFMRIATAAALAMGVTTFAAAQERMSPSDQPSRSAPSAQPGVPGSPDMNSGATGGDSRGGPGASQAPQITEKNVGPMLQAVGYTDVKSIKQSGDTITADAKRDGKNVKLKIDAKTGKVNESRG
jgi:hypothetical protein